MTWICFRNYRSRLTTEKSTGRTQVGLGYEYEIFTDETGRPVRRVIYHGGQEVSEKTGYQVGGTIDQAHRWAKSDIASRRANGMDS